jgi:hypothetical protein
MQMTEDPVDRMDASEHSDPAIVPDRRSATDRSSQHVSFSGLQTRLRREALRSASPLPSQVVLRDPWEDRFRVDDEHPDASRIRVRRMVEENEPDDELVAMATIQRSLDGRSLTNFSGGKAHVNGFVCCPKSHHMLHVQGTGQEDLVRREQTVWNTTEIVTEGWVIKWRDGEHRPDVQITGADGRIWLIEVKRNERDLVDPRLRRNIAYASEVLRRCDIGYELVFENEIFESPRHRRNVELFASRGFVHVSRVQFGRLANHVAGKGAASTFGELTDLLSPHDALLGAAVVQGLVVRRRLEVDLTKRITADTPVTIH